MPSSQPGTDPIEPDYGASLDFLRRWAPKGPWVLTAINPDKKRGRNTFTRTFDPDDEDHLLAWLEQHGTRKKRNCYFLVNRPFGRPDDKPTRKNIAELTWLHVDVDPADPPEGAVDLEAHYTAERERILGVLREPPEGLPAPTCITFSGGGYQAFWRLELPMVLDGSPEQFEDAALYNRWIEQSLGGDNCHNVDRVMRLPGTVNRPNEKKRKGGRTEKLAEEVEWPDPERTYGIGEFEKAEPKARRAAAPTAQVSGEVRRFESVDEIVELRERPRCRVVIQQGLDPDEPKKLPSKSEWLFYACNEMVRAGCSGDTIYSVITDPAFAISASVLDKGTGVDAYALRQIERAQEFAVDPRLRELNDQHAVIESHGGKCRITSWESSSLGEGCRQVLQFQSFADFRNRYSNRFVEVPVGDGKTVRKPIGKWWTEQQMRRQYRGIVFDPSVDGDLGGLMNLWRGFSVAATPGEYPLFRELVDEVLADGDEEVSAYLWRWTAWLVQYRHLPAEVALVLRSGQGTGKGTFAKTLGRLFGQHFVHASSSAEVTGKFNAHMRDCVLLFADEAFLGGSHDAIGTLKRILTEPTLRIEKKGYDSSEWPNRLHVIIASNETWVVPADADDRRFVVLDVSERRKEAEGWFAALNAEMAGGGLSALLHDLLEMDLGDWHPRRDRPRTGALTDQKVSNLKGLERIWFECLRGGELPFGDTGEGGEVWFPSSVFLTHANEVLRPRKAHMGNELARLLYRPQGNHSGVGMEFERDRRVVNGYVVTPLPEARRRWDERRFPYSWDDTQEWSVETRVIDTRAYDAFG